MGQLDLMCSLLTPEGVCFAIAESRARAGREEQKKNQNVGGGGDGGGAALVDHLLPRRLEMNSHRSCRSLEI